VFILGEKPMRIFVTVGNALVPFDRLLSWVCDALGELSLETPIEGVCQHGPSHFRPPMLIAKEHLSRQEFERELGLADVVVCHAGVGTLAEAMRYGHRPIVVARRAEYSEIVNDHQLEIVSALLSEGRLVAPEDKGALLGALRLYTRGQEKRAPARELDPTRILPVSRVLQRGPARERPNAIGKVLVEVLAALGPSLDQMRVR
jgi:UDP-N-acetylglucosamine transferase subunit ALG13